MPETPPDLNPDAVALFNSGGPWRYLCAVMKEMYGQAGREIAANGSGRGNLALVPYFCGRQEALDDLLRRIAAAAGGKLVIESPLSIQKTTNPT